MASREDALRGYIRSSKAADLFDAILDSSDPVWAEDELIRDLLAVVDADASSGERQS